MDQMRAVLVWAYWLGEPGDGRPWSRMPPPSHPRARNACSVAGGLVLAAAALERLRSS